MPLTFFLHFYSQALLKSENFFGINWIPEIATDGKDGHVLIDTWKSWATLIFQVLIAMAAKNYLRKCNG